MKNHHFNGGIMKNVYGTMEKFVGTMNNVGGPMYNAKNIM